MEFFGFLNMPIMFDVLDRYEGGRSNPSNRSQTTITLQVTVNTACTVMFKIGVGKQPGVVDNWLDYNDYGRSLIFPGLQKRTCTLWNWSVGNPKPGETLKCYLTAVIYEPYEKDVGTVVLTLNCR
jgi:hypothetical protein